MQSKEHNISLSKICFHLFILSLLFTPVLILCYNWIQYKYNPQHSWKEKIQRDKRQLDMGIHLQNQGQFSASGRFRRRSIEPHFSMKQGTEETRNGDGLIYCCGSNQRSRHRLPPTCQQLSMSQQLQSQLKLKDKSSPKLPPVLTLQTGQFPT